MKYIANPASLVPPLIVGPWTKKWIDDIPKHGLKVFSCFHCGGGSSFGYKLAGFDVVGGVEIDPEMMALYKKNHNPRLPFQMPIQEFKRLETMPDELMDLDVLDGSPPCSSFSMAGARERDWGKEKKFREGQSRQVLDDLFFDFIEVADRLRPKMVVAENVKGLIIGNARGYVREIFQRFFKAGYDCQLFLLNASRMGVPQARERTFFIARRMDLEIPKLVLDFNEPVITVGDAFEGLSNDETGTKLTPRAESLWRRTMPGESFSKVNNGSWFNWIRLHNSKPSSTVPATCRLTHPDEPRFITYKEAIRLQTFPEDYDFGDTDGRYVCGMSVPPLMMQRVSSIVARALLANRAASVGRSKPSSR